jgi:hypothetical protein
VEHACTRGRGQLKWGAPTIDHADQAAGSGAAVTHNDHCRIIECRAATAADGVVIAVPETAII